MPTLAIPVEVYRAHVTRFRVSSRLFFMLTIHEWVKGSRLCRTRALFQSTACASICQSCIQARPSTGEPCAGDPHARFGGEGDREFNRSSLPLSANVKIDRAMTPNPAIRVAEHHRAVHVADRFGKGLEFMENLRLDENSVALFQVSRLSRSGF